MSRFASIGDKVIDNAVTVLLSHISPGEGPRIVIVRARPDDDIKSVIQQVLERSRRSKKQTVLAIEFAGDRTWLWNGLNQAITTSIAEGQGLGIPENPLEFGKGARTAMIDSWSKAEKSFVFIFSGVDSWKTSDWVEFREFGRRFLAKNDSAIVLITEHTQDASSRKLQGIQGSRRFMTVPFLDVNDVKYLLGKHARKLNERIKEESFAQMLLEVGNRSLTGVKDLIHQFSANSNGKTETELIENLKNMLAYSYALDHRRKRSHWD